MSICVCYVGPAPQGFDEGNFARLGCPAVQAAELIGGSVAVYHFPGSHFERGNGCCCKLQPFL